MCQKIFDYCIIVLYNVPNVNLTMGEMWNVKIFDKNKNSLYIVRLQV